MPTRRNQARRMLDKKGAMPPSGNPDLARLSRINDRLDGHDRQLADHEVRISATEREQREAAMDIAMLSDIVLRARRRAAGASLRRGRVKPAR